MDIRLTAFLFTLLTSISSGQSDEWKQGSVAICATEEAIALYPMGTNQLMDINVLPHYTSGLLVAKATQAKHLTLLASNGVLIDFKGNGYFAIERFEQRNQQAVNWLQANKEPGQSRMLLNFRAGKLIVDQRALQPASQLLLETPIGRLSRQGEALFMVELSKDPRKQTYSFIIYCIQGTVRFVDFTERTYIISKGQLISGAGSALAPSVQVAEITSDDDEYLQDQAERATSIKKMELSEARFQEAKQPIPLTIRSDNHINEPSTTRDPNTRPIIIEYAPRSQPVTPFKGVAQPRSDEEIDLF